VWASRYGARADYRARTGANHSTCRRAQTDHGAGGRGDDCTRRRDDRTRRGCTYRRANRRGRANHGCHDGTGRQTGRVGGQHADLPVGQ
jgi:hypothetical protein